MSTSDRSNSVQLKMGDNIDAYRFKLLLSQLSKCSIRRPLKVDLHTLCIAGKGVWLIASHFKQYAPSALNVLSIVGNDDIQSHDGSLTYVAEALQANCHLTKLNLNLVDLNCVGENGSILTKMLCTSKTLTHFNLSCSRLFRLGSSLHFSRSTAECNTYPLEFLRSRGVFRGSALGALAPPSLVPRPLWGRD